MAFAPCPKYSGQFFFSYFVPYMEPLFWAKIIDAKRIKMPYDVVIC
jgi:hypothetical protein